MESVRVIERAYQKLLIERDTLVKANEHLRAQLRNPLVAVAAKKWQAVPRTLTTPMYDAIVAAVENRQFAAWPADVWEDALRAAPQPAQFDWQNPTPTNQIAGRERGE
jgi:hypothetical protein